MNEGKIKSYAKNYNDIKELARNQVNEIERNL
jgi:hypothetical protein